MRDIKTRNLANQNAKAIKKILQLNPPSLRTQFPVMATPPTIAAAQMGGATQIASGVFKSVLAGGTTLNPLFRYPVGDIKRADWNGSAYANTNPLNNVVGNFAVFNPTYGTFTPGSWAQQPIYVELGFDGTQLEFYTLGEGGRYRILVDEGDGYKFTSSSAGNSNGSLPADGNYYRILVTFATRQPRSIRFETEYGRFSGVTIGPNDTLSPVAKPLPPKCVILGDSFSEPTAATNAFTGWASIACQLLGWEGSPSGAGGTGYINPGTAPRVPFIGRVQTDVINQKPQCVIIAGGINDVANTASDIQNAATTLIRAIQNGLPNTMIFVLSNFHPGNPNASALQCASALQAAALACKVPFIDALNGKTYLDTGEQLVNPAIGSWVTGTGNTGNVQPTGNASYYTTNDGTHPSPAGHTYLGQRTAAEIYRILNWYNRYN